jgi:hypothetical protein
MKFGAADNPNAIPNSDFAVHYPRRIRFERASACVAAHQLRITNSRENACWLE